MNRRSLKKSINQRAELLAARALEHQEKYHDDRKEVDSILDNLAEMLDDVMSSINKHSDLYGPEVKVHFLKIEKLVENTMENLEARLNNLAQP